MKHRLVVFIFLTLLIVIMGINYMPKIDDDTLDAYQVVHYADNNLNNSGSSDYYLLFDDFKLDSNNFVKVLSFFDKYEYNLVEVYPYINPLYQEKLKNIVIINLDTSSLSYNNIAIYNIYLKELEDHFLTDEIDKTLVNGVRIKMLKINVNSTVLKTFLIRYRDIKYGNSPYGLFKKIDI